MKKLIVCILICAATAFAGTDKATYQFHAGLPRHTAAAIATFGATAKTARAGGTLLDTEACA